MKTDKNYIAKTLEPINKNTHSITIGNVYSIFEEKFSPEFYFSGECHAPWEMVYVIDGTVGITADDKIHILSPGDMIFHKPMEFHKIWGVNNDKLHVFICSFDLSGGFSHRLRDGLYQLNENTHRQMNTLLGLLRSQTVMPTSEYFIAYYEPLVKNSDMTAQLAIKYLELIFLELSMSDKRTHSKNYNENMLLYTQIAQILEEHVYDKITIPQIASLCGVSSATVKNCFSKYADCGIHKYFLGIKIRTAIELLKSGKNVNEVSDMLQFANPNYFSYVFKRETGTCASSYRR